MFGLPLQFPTNSSAPVIAGFYTDVRGLAPGSAYQVRLRPVGALASAIQSNASGNAWYDWSWGSSDLPASSWSATSVFITTCTCDKSSPTGAPMHLNVTQAYAVMMFR